MFQNYSTLPIYVLLIVENANKDTKKKQSLVRIYKKRDDMKQKNEQALSNPSPLYKKSQKAFLFTCI